MNTNTAKNNKALEDIITGGNAGSMSHIDPFPICDDNSMEIADDVVVETCKVFGKVNRKCRMMQTTSTKF